MCAPRRELRCTVVERPAQNRRSNCREASRNFQQWPRCIQSPENSWSSCLYQGGKTKIRRSRFKAPTTPCSTLAHYLERTSPTCRTALAPRFFFDVPKGRVEAACGGYYNWVIGCDDIDGQRNRKDDGAVLRRLRH